MDDDPLLGRTLAGRYRLIARLGSGGMSAVYLARHVLIERLSAIKVLHEDLTLEDVHKEHFLREARAVNRINHPNIVEISDYGEASLTIEQGRGLRRHVVYLVMEYVPGESLQRLLARGPLPWQRVVPIAAQVAAALARAHQTGVIHRDIKPENILLVPRRDGGDLVKLTDFGVAKIVQVSRQAERGADQVFGTPGYIAPEYVLGETSIDGRADLYSLGVVVYQALTGALPFDADDPAELLTLPLSEEPVPASARTRDLPPLLEELVMRCLRRRPDERPVDAFAFMESLRAAVGDIRIEPPSLPPPAVVPLVETIDDEPPVSRHAPSIPVAPRLGTMTPNALVVAWRMHWEALTERVADGRRNVSPALADALHRAMLLTEGLDRAATIVAETQRALDALEHEAREFRATLGRAIDELARDLSKAHARVLDLTSERARLHLQRRHAKNASTADVILWEEVAIDDELRKSKALREDLGFQIGTLQDELFRRNNAHEERVQRKAAELEGESAAIATLHRELESVSAEVAELLA